MKKYTSFRIRGIGVSYLLDKKAMFVILAFAFLLFVAMIICIGIGDMKIHPLEVVKVLFGYGSEMHELVVKSFRLPRILVAVLVGAALAVSGGILQGVVRNPLASPDVIGITSGAGAAAVTFLAYLSDPNSNSLIVSINWLPVAAFTGATLSAMLVYLLAWKDGVSPIRMVLVGVGLAAAMQAITTVMILFGPLYLATEATLWLTGSVYGATWEDVAVLTPWIGILIPFSFILSRHLNVQELGDETATSVGSRIQMQRFFLILVSTALAGGAVAFAGGISFVGLIAPHIARKLVGSAFGALLPLSALIGGLVVLLADLVARTAFLPLQVPAGIFTAAIGAPYFIFLLYKNRNM